LTFAIPFHGFETAITYGGYLQPLPQAAVKAAGDDFGRAPVGAGPYMIKEWRSGERIVLERNPYYTWGPSFTHGGPFYIQNIEVRYISDYNSILAGLEAGEIDYALVAAKDIQRIRDSGKFQVFESVQAGIDPYIVFNTSKAPFDDVKVRQAFNLAVDKQALIKTLMFGGAVEQPGPCSKTMVGCWSATQMDVGYGFDLEHAKKLMMEAGYTVGANGMLEKDGQPFKVTLLHGGNSGLAEVLQQQYKALGVDLTIQSGETAAQFDQLRTGEYQMAITGLSYPTTDQEVTQFSSEFGSNNFGFYNDPLLDELAMGIIVTMDPAENAKAQQALEQYIIDQAYIVPLYAPIQYIVISNRVKGIVFSEKVSIAAGLTQVYLDDAWIEEE